MVCLMLISYILLSIITYSILRSDVEILAGPVVFFKVHMIKNGKQRWREGAQHFG